jgi:hypothetical protein
MTAKWLVVLVSILVASVVAAENRTLEALDDPATESEAADSCRGSSS